MRNSTLVIIPAFQEEKSMAKVIQGVHALQFDCLVINDCSRDKTAQIADEMGAFVVSLPVNSGYGVALQTGYKFAWRHGYDFVIQMDADGQHESDFLENLIEPVWQGSCDLCIGSRFLHKESYKVPLMRRMGMSVFSFLLRMFTGKEFTDPTSGFQAMNRRTLQFFITEMFPRDYPDADLLLMVHKMGLRIAEVPAKMKKNESGKSMHSGLKKPIYYVFRMFMGILVTVLRRPPKLPEFIKNHDVIPKESDNAR